MEKLNVGTSKLGLHLTPEQIEKFAIYYQELIDWNQRVNLTAITDYDEVQIKHFLDSLTVILVLKKQAGGLHVIDVGTGAGLPGMPLKIIHPDIKLTLLEATAKKADFLHHLKRRLGLGDIEVVVGRAEDIAHKAEYREKFDLVLSRAVASLPALV
ncbi:16S rRNA (guanine(527)-N(7))-methyltransferase RsmG, partial [Chloroflexota bacterium]